MKTMRLTVMVHREDGGLWAEVPDVPGVFAAGDTPGELLESLREGLGLVLETDLTRSDTAEFARSVSAWFHDDATEHSAAGRIEKDQMELVVSC